MLLLRVLKVFVILNTEVVTIFFHILHILALKPVFKLEVTINVIGKTGSIFGYIRGCFSVFITSWIILYCA